MGRCARHRTVQDRRVLGVAAATISEGNRAGSRLSGGHACIRMVQLSSTVFVVVIPFGGFAAALALSLWETACWRSLTAAFDSAMRTVSELLAARLYRADPSLIVSVLVTVLVPPLPGVLSSP